MLPREEHEKRLKLWRQGLSDIEIAQAVFVTPEAICCWRRDHGGLKANDKRRVIRPEQEAVIREMYQDGLSDGQIAQAVGMTKTTIYSYRRRCGLPGNYGKGGKPQGNAMARLRALFEKGCSPEEAARETGMMLESVVRSGLWEGKVVGNGKL